MKSNNLLEKVDKFLVILITVLILMAALVVFTFKGIFSAYITAYEIDQSKLGGTEQVNRESLEEAYSFVFNKQTLPLKVK